MGLVTGVWLAVSARYLELDAVTGLTAASQASVTGLVTEAGEPGAVVYPGVSGLGTKLPAAPCIVGRAVTGVVTGVAVTSLDVAGLGVTGVVTGVEVPGVMTGDVFTGLAVTGLGVAGTGGGLSVTELRTVDRTVLVPGVVTGLAVPSPLRTSCCWCGCCCVPVVAFSSLSTAPSPKNFRKLLWATPGVPVLGDPMGGRLAASLPNVADCTS